MATNLSNWSNFISEGNKPRKVHSTSSQAFSDTLDIQEIWKKATEAKKAEPLDIEWVVTHLFNLDIKKTDLGNTASGFLNELDDKWCIFVNKYENERRQRFTIAHELGHFIFHKNNKSLEKDLIFFRDETNNKEEREANDFASELLMPENMVKAYIKEGYNTIQMLADKFNLSTSAVRYRVYKLGLISEY